MNPHNHAKKDAAIDLGPGPNTGGVSVGVRTLNINHGRRKIEEKWLPPEARSTTREQVKPSVELERNDADSPASDVWDTNSPNVLSLVPVERRLQR